MCSRVYTSFKKIKSTTQTILGTYIYIVLSRRFPICVRGFKLGPHGKLSTMHMRAFISYWEYPMLWRLRPQVKAFWEVLPYLQQYISYSCNFKLAHETLTQVRISLVFALYLYDNLLRVHCTGCNF